VVAISTVAGNVSVDQATRNAFRILAAAGVASYPRVARGAEAPLERALVTAGHIHGDDGLGNLGQFVEPDGRPRHADPEPAIEMRDGADLILDLANQLREELVVVALGPLTNLALALQRGRRALSGVGRIVVMGGAVAVPGNVTPAAEFNFYVDPEAAAAVFESGLPIDVIPLDVTSQVVLPQAALARRLGACPSSLGRFVADVCLHGFAVGRPGSGIILHDPLAVGVAVDVTDATGYEQYRQRVSATIEAFGGRFLVRGGATDILEGDWTPKRLVILEFPDMAQLKAWYQSPEYLPLIELRQRTTKSMLVAVEGVPSS
jgi:purine nucleosidase/pyrimidine-specific ribonucleoside hydrolase